jgi:hypothetical protein
MYAEARPNSSNWRSLIFPSLARADVEIGLQCKVGQVAVVRWHCERAAWPEDVSVTSATPFRSWEDDGKESGGPMGVILALRYTAA